MGQIFDHNTAKRFRAYGFTELEIQQLMGTDSKWNGSAWASALKSRTQYRKNMKLKGYNNRQIDMFINNYYLRRKEKYNPFEFIKAEYSRPPGIKDFKQALQQRRLKRQIKQRLTEYQFTS